MTAVSCAKHGEQPETFVCQHIVETLSDKQARGFHWSSADDSPYPDAWCWGCNERVLAAGGEWTDEVLDYTRVRLLCAACYQVAKALNGF